MKKKYILSFITSIVLLVFTSGCYREPVYYQVDPQLQKYLDQFTTIASTYGVNVPKDNLILQLTWGLADQLHCIGLTTLVSDGGQRKIEFDQNWWLAATESQRQTLSLHEFGHGFLRRYHNNNFSIMNPTRPEGWPQCPDQLYGLADCDHKPLLDELFKNAGH